MFITKMPELEQKNFPKRNIAYKLSVSDIVNCKFVNDELSAGYIKFGDTNIFRVNIMAALVYKSEGASYVSAVVDDGTSKISLRSFENANAFSKFDVGDIIMAIGKIREYDNEKYIVPEILKKVDDIKWVNVWKIHQIRKGLVSISEKSEGAINYNDEEILSLIKELDGGEGVYIDDVVKSSGNDNAEAIINKMLETGDIFEIKPGKIKVLE